METDANAEICPIHNLSQQDQRVQGLSRNVDKASSLADRTKRNMPKSQMQREEQRRLSNEHTE